MKQITLNILLLLTIAAFILLIVGLIKPSIVLSLFKIKKDQHSRRSVLNYFLSSALIFFLYFCVAAQPSITILGYIKFTLFLSIFLALFKPKLISRLLKNDLTRKQLLICTVLLFIGSYIVPNISSSIYKEINKSPEQIAAEKQAKEEYQRKQTEEKAEKERLQEAERVERLRIENEQKTQKRKAQLEKLASQYCSERAGNIRSYLVGDIKGDKDGKIDITSAKKGNELTDEDCQKTTTAIFKLKKTDLSEPASEEILDIIQGSVTIGMHKNELIYAVGLPNKVNTTHYGTGINEQLIYNKSTSIYNLSAYYVYLDNGEVTSYQDF